MGLVEQAPLAEKEKSRKKCLAKSGKTLNLGLMFLTKLVSFPSNQERSLPMSMTCVEKSCVSSGLAPVIVPIRTIGPRERERIERHLLDLNGEDRYLRFGYVATDAHVKRYVSGLDFERDELFGIYNRRLDLIAMAHLAFAPSDQDGGCAEFGVSVARTARGRGFGSRLFERAVVVARNEGVGMLFIHALSENAAMLKIARKAGAKVVRDGAESEAHLQLPVATFDSHLSEIALEHFAEVDFHLKTRAKQFWSFLSGVQEMRSGLRAARAKASP